MSWYNSHGYISPNFEEEQRRNTEILRMSFEDVIQLCTIQQIDEFKHHHTVESLQKTLESLERMILKYGEGEKINSRILDLRNNIKNYPFYLSLNIRKIEEQNQMLIDEAKHLFPHIDTSFNIKEYVTQMLKSINNRFDSSDKLSCEKYAFISNLLRFIFISRVLYYNVIFLTKEINKPPVGGKSKKQRKTKTKSKKRRKPKRKKRRKPIFS